MSAVTTCCAARFPISSFALCEFRTESITRLDRFLLFHGVSMTSNMKNECDERKRIKKNQNAIIQFDCTIEFVIVACRVIFMIFFFSLLRFFRTLRASYEVIRSAATEVYILCEYSISLFASIAMEHLLRLRPVSKHFLIWILLTFCIIRDKCTEMDSLHKWSLPSSKVFNRWHFLLDWSLMDGFFFHAFPSHPKTSTRSSRWHQYRLNLRARQQLRAYII